MAELIKILLNANSVEYIKFIGNPLLFLLILASSGLSWGVFLPGSSLIFVGGLLASMRIFELWVVLLVCLLASIIGNIIGYSHGKRAGKSLFKSSVSSTNLIRAQEFYEKYGTKTIVFARFIPVIRTFIPIVAGANKVNFKKFTLLNIVGGAFWVWTLGLAGYLLGSLIPDIQQYLLSIFGVLILMCFVYPVLSLYVENKKSIHKKVAERVKHFFKYGVFK